MELRLRPALERGCGNVCWCRAQMQASSSSSSLSFCYTSTNPSLLYKPFRKQEKKKEAITRAVKWEKDPSLDAVIQREKKLRRVLQIKNLLMKEPGMCMSLRELGRHRKKLRLTENRRLVTMIKQYPSVFELFEEGISNTYFRLTPEAEDLFLEEHQLKTDMESLLVSKIRKLLMMSIDKTLLVFKLAHLKKDLGLPDDFKTSLLEKYPQFFKPVQLEGGPALELTSWDPKLAVSVWEKKLQSEPLDHGVLTSHAQNARRFRFHKSNHWKRKSKMAISKIQDLTTHISPYAEFAHLTPASHDAERHACAVVHELLSLTLEKRVNIDFLTHFRKDYRFSQQLHGMLVRHPEFFYVSRKGDRDSVFLREAYRGRGLLDKEPLALFKERLGMLIARNEQALQEGSDEEQDDGEDEEEEDDGEDDEEDEGDSISINDASQNVSEDSNEAAPDRRERVPHRPLIILQRERELANFVSSADRW